MNQISTTSGSGVTSTPNVAIANNGQATASWTMTDSSNAHPVVQFASKALSASSWPQAPATPGANDLTASGTDSTSPSLAITPDGTTTIAWARGALVEARTRAGLGGTFAAAQTLTNPLTSPGGVDAVGGGDGSTTVLWSGQLAGASTVSGAYRPPGGSFSATPNAPGADQFPVGASDGLGNVAATWANSPTPGNYQTQASALVTAPPTISSVSFPATASSGVAFPYSATVSDNWVTPSSVQWGFGDGTTGPLNGTKTYSGPGNFQATLTAADSFGNSAMSIRSIAVSGPGGGTPGGGGPPGGPPGGGPGPGVPGAPALSGLTIAPRTFSAAKSGASVAKKPKPAKVGATVRYRDSQAASTTFAVTRTVKGIRSRGKCVAKPRRKKRGAKSCSRTQTLGAFTRSDRPGINAFRFRGRVAGHKLARGSYQLRAVARNAGGKSSKPVSARFTIKR